MFVSRLQSSTVGRSEWRLIVHVNDLVTYRSGLVVLDSQIAV